MLQSQESEGRSRTLAWLSRTTDLGGEAWLRLSPRSASDSTRVPAELELRAGV